MRRTYDQGICQTCAIGHRGDVRGPCTHSRHARRPLHRPHNRQCAGRPLRAGYPTYSPARIDTAVTTYLVYVSIIGALGVISWLWTIRIVNAGKRWARGAATAMFALATGIALFDLLVKDTSGDTGLPPLLGWIGMLPCLAGLLAVTLLWRRS